MDAGIGETMAISALIGAGVGGASSAAQGGDPLKGALMGGALGAVTGGFAGGAGAGAAGSAVADSTTLVPGAVAGAGTGAAGAGTGTALTDAALGSGSGFGLTGASTGGIGIGAGNGAIGGLTAPTAGISSLGLPAAATGTLGAGATTGAAASGLGGAFGTGLSNMGLAADVGGGYLAGTIGAPIKGAQNPNASPYTGPLTQLHYSPGSFTPSTPAYAPNSVYVPHYAAGGITQAMPNLDFAGNGSYPMSQQNTPQFNTPTQAPLGAQEAMADGNDPQTNPLTGEPTQMMASGGIAGLLKGRGDGMSDDIHATIGGSQPARLADGEFVVPADVVSHLGNGSTDAGAKHLYKMMDKVRHARTGRKAQGKQIKAGGYLPA